MARGYREFLKDVGKKEETIAILGKKVDSDKQYKRQHTNLLHVPIFTAKGGR